MESQYKKWVNLSYLAVAVLLGYIVFSLSQRLTSTYDLETHVQNIDLIIRVLSIVAGGILFLILYRNERANEFMSEVVVELSRVTWPTRRETASATLVVIIMVMISGMVLGFFDYVWTKILQLVL
jgi:preprotein translocase subunit SecE